MQNYHKHTSYSNIMTPDSICSYEDYAKRAVELGQQCLCSLEHGWQGKYYECYEIAQKYNLKFIFGTEAYWVKDRFEKDRTNAHIVLLARNETGRREINKILSTANIDGVYYKPRVDLNLLKTLSPQNVFITTACIGFWGYENMYEVILELFHHFQDSFFLEIQYHNTVAQISLNKKILKLHHKYNIPMILGMDSHYIFNTAEDKLERDNFLKSKNIYYENEDGWFMDYPDEETAKMRLRNQNLFTEQQILDICNNSDILLQFEDIEFNKDVKLPNIHKDKTQEERNQLLRNIVFENLEKYLQDADISIKDKYIKATNEELDIIIDTGMADYFLLDYSMVKSAIKEGGIITRTGRGSGASFFVNSMLGFSNIDRLKTPVFLYPSRFMSKTRILETKSLPDLDLNVGNPDCFEKVQTKIMGEGHSYPMIAFGTVKEKSAWKLYAKANDINIDDANQVSKDLGKYESALNFASDEDRDLISIADYVEEKYLPLVEKSKAYRKIISDKKRHPCAYLLYDGDIMSEIGLIECKSSNGNKYLTTVIDGEVAENYKFLKNDILKVDVWNIIAKICKRLNISIPTINELELLVEKHPEVWEIYAEGLTLGVNQVERKQTAQKVMRYKPKNISELTAFVAGIRPSFKSMYSSFEKRENFKYNIKAFDELIQTEQFPYSYILYQEQIMATLGYAGFPLDVTYQIIKDIAKKHPEKVKPLENKFKDGFTKQLVENDNIELNEAREYAKKVWTIIDNSCSYGFNASHALCVAYDSLYCAYFKKLYPYEFYEVLLNEYSIKGNKDKVALLKNEMQQFGISEGYFKFGLDNRKFTLDKQNNVINASLVSLKGISQSTADKLYSVGQDFNSLDNIFTVFEKLKTSKVNSDIIVKLIHIDYFSDFGEVFKIEKAWNLFLLFEGVTVSKKKEKFFPYLDIVKKHSRETNATYRDLDKIPMLEEILDSVKIKKDIRLRCEYEYDIIGYNRIIINELQREDIWFVQDIVQPFSAYYCQLYNLYTGELINIKLNKKIFNENPIEIYSIIQINKIETKNKKRKIDNQFIEIDEQENILTQYRIIMVK